MANPFSVAPLGGLQTYANIGNTVGAGIQNYQAEQQQQALQAEAQRLMREGSPQEIAAFSAANPEIGQAMQQGVQFASEQTRQNMQDSMQRVIAGEDPVRVIQERAEMVRAQGGDPSDTVRDLELAQQDPEAYREMISRLYAMRFGTEGVPGMGDGPSIGTYNPRDYTTQSFAEFQRTGDPSVLQRYESSRVIDVGGVPHLFNPADRTITPGRITSGGFVPTGQPKPSGDQAGDQSGRQPTGQQPTGDQPITAETVAGTRATITSAEERAKLDSALAKQGYRLTEDNRLEPIPGGEAAREQEQAAGARTEQQRQAFEKADVMTGKIDAALDQIDWSSTGAIGQFTQFIGGTQGRDLAANLDTIKANLGFDALQDMRDASPTGGALGQVTEKEIRFLQSLLESLDQAQSGSQLRSNLEQLRSGVQKTRRMLSGEIEVVESEDQVEDLPSGSEYVVADDPARRVRTKGAANILEMSLEQLNQMNPTDMTEEQLRQAARRYDQLGAQ